MVLQARKWSKLAEEQNLELDNGRSIAVATVFGSHYPVPFVVDDGV